MIYGKSISAVQQNTGRHKSISFERLFVVCHIYAHLCANMCLACKGFPNKGDMILNVPIGLI